MRTNSIQTPLKKHSDIVAEIEKNSRHQVYKMSFEHEKNHINRRKLVQYQSNKEQKGKISVYTQTLCTIKNTNVNMRQKQYINEPSSSLISTSNGLIINTNSINNINNINNINRRQKYNEVDSTINLTLTSAEMDQNQRIAQMQKINREVLKIYSRKSAIVDIGMKAKKEDLLEKRGKMNYNHNYNSNTNSNYNYNYKEER